jgi:hypothetical protein
VLAVGRLVGRLDELEVLGAVDVGDDEEAVAVVVGARMLLWAKALARAGSEWDWWVDALERVVSPTVHQAYGVRCPN